MVYSAIVFLLAFLVLAGFYVVTKNTYLELNFRNGNVWSLLLYREFALVFISVLLVLWYGVKAFDGTILNARDEDIVKVSWLAIYAVSVFCITLSLLVRFLPISITLIDRKEAIKDKRVKRFADAAVIVGVGVFLVANFFLSYKHAFLTNIMTDQSLLSIRLENAYKSALPSQLAQLIPLTAWIVSIYAGVALALRKYASAIAYFLIALFLSAVPGDKAPLLVCFVIFGLSYASAKGVRLSFKAAAFSVFVYFPFLYAIVFLIVSFQMPDLSFENFNIYLLNRVGVGQMAGVFETFSIPQLPGEFFWHFFPGAAFFVDYIPYEKMLMLATESYDFTEMGVKNSFFISEAYGIGGYFLLLLSPIIVGASYILGIYGLFLFLMIFFGRSVAILYAFPLYLLFSSITGGFSSFPVFKGLLLNMICLGVIWAIYTLLRISLGKNKCGTQCLQ